MLSGKENFSIKWEDANVNIWQYDELILTAPGEVSWSGGGRGSRCECYGKE